MQSDKTSDTGDTHFPFLVERGSILHKTGYQEGIGKETKNGSIRRLEMSAYCVASSILNQTVDPLLAKNKQEQQRKDGTI